ncbi:hypothetical protein H5410_046606 [Solanum commersonii]|uniref:HECT-type E3 ubiquitin transferase n=1 Tax=Solanum commersonii TaxID=4109 RepID=A0A9J5XFZ7_SOLCO|nr:hypothetical protein H5410_046606 [Solanum commersonii]
MKQRLIYHGKHLELSQMLSECGIQNDDTLQLIGKMRSTCHPYTWKLMSDLNLVIHDVCNYNENTNISFDFTRMTKMLTDFLTMNPKDGADGSEEYLQIIIHSFVLVDLVKLYVSPSITKKQVAHGCIYQFMDSCKTLFANPVTVYRIFAAIISELCKILRGAAGVDDTLYIFFHSSLAAMMKGNVHDVKCVLRLQDVYPFVHELETRLSHDLELSVQSAEFIQLSESDVRVRKNFEVVQGFEGNVLGENEAKKSCVVLSDREAQKQGILRVAHLQNKEATGLGMLREWFPLVCEAIFNPQNALFVSCLNDGRRFFPNPASKVDPLNLEYFIFYNRMIALALLHRVQISITFDRVFFLQLAREDISLEDIRNADPYLYSGCKKILEMDTKMVDEDILGLTFVSEDEELGSRKVVELYPNGKNTIVNCENRDSCVNLLV